jgi:hypothetical protein
MNSTLLKGITVHTRKKSPYKSNINITKGMTFKELIAFIFPSGPANNKRFIIKSSLDGDAKEYLPDQIMDTIFFEDHVNIWVDMELISVDLNELF